MNLLPPFPVPGRFHPPRLSRELRAAGITAVEGTRAEKREDQATLPDVEAIIDWLPGHPTPAERIAAAAVLVAHDRDGDRKEAEAFRQEIRDLWARWDSLTADELRQCLKHVVKRAFTAELQ